MDYHNVSVYASLSVPFFSCTTYTDHCEWCIALWVWSFCIEHGLKKILWEQSTWWCANFVTKTYLQHHLTWPWLSIVSRLISLIVKMLAITITMVSLTITRTHESSSVSAAMGRLLRVSSATREANSYDMHSSCWWNHVKPVTWPLIIPVQRPVMSVVRFFSEPGCWLYQLPVTSNCWSCTWVLLVLCGPALGHQKDRF